MNTTAQGRQAGRQAGGTNWSIKLLRSPLAGCCFFVLIGVIGVTKSLCFGLVLTVVSLLAVETTFFFPSTEDITRGAVPNTTMPIRVGGVCVARKRNDKLSLASIRGGEALASSPQPSTGFDLTVFTVASFDFARASFDFAEASVDFAEVVSKPAAGFDLTFIVIALSPKKTFVSTSSRFGAAGFDLTFIVLSSKKAFVLTARFGTVGFDLTFVVLSFKKTFVLTFRVAKERKLELF